MSKISNILTMIEYLSTGRKYSIKELSEKLEVTPRMIRVYKDEIEKAGIYIDTIRGPYGGYILNQNVNVPKRFITPSEIDIENREIFNKINRAIKEKRKCFIKYYSKDKMNISERIIQPHEIILYGNEWGVASYCEMRCEARHFYVNRIISIEILDDFFN